MATSNFPSPYIPDFVQKRFQENFSASLEELGNDLEKRAPFLSTVACGKRFQRKRTWVLWLFETIEAYRMNKFADINNIIRYRGAQYERQENIYKFELYYDYLLARSLTFIMSYAFPRTPYDIWVYRGAYFTPQQMEVLMNSKELNFEAVLSTTTNINIAKSFSKSKYGFDESLHRSVLYAMLIPSGTPCSNFEIEKNGESEITFPPNMRATIIDKEVVKDGTTIIHCVMRDLEPSPICPSPKEFLSEFSQVPCFMYNVVDRDTFALDKSYDEAVSVLKRLDGTTPEKKTVKLISGGEDTTPHIGFAKRQDGEFRWM